MLNRQLSHWKSRGSAAASRPPKWAPLPHAGFAAGGEDEESPGRRRRVLLPLSFGEAVANSTSMASYTGHSSARDQETPQVVPQALAARDRDRDWPVRNDCRALAWLFRGPALSGLVLGPSTSWSCFGRSDHSLTAHTTSKVGSTGGISACRAARHQEGSVTCLPH